MTLPCNVSLVGPLSWNLPVRAQVTTEFCEGTSSSSCLHLGQNSRSRQCMYQ